MTPGCKLVIFMKGKQKAKIKQVTELWRVEEMKKSERHVFLREAQSAHLAFVTQRSGAVCLGSRFFSLLII